MEGSEGGLKSRKTKVKPVIAAYIPPFLSFLGEGRVVVMGLWTHIGFGNTSARITMESASRKRPPSRSVVECLCSSVR